MTALLALLAPLLDKILGHVLPDPAERQRAVLEALGRLTENDIAQLRVNAAEAEHPSVFVAGWRPFIGWTCGVALAYAYVVVPFLTFGFSVAGQALPTLPLLDGNLWELMFGMLGMGALRTFEKVKGAAGSPFR